MILSQHRAFNNSFPPSKCKKKSLGWVGRVQNFCDSFSVMNPEFWMTLFPDIITQAKQLLLWKSTDYIHSSFFQEVPKLHWIPLPPPRCLSRDWAGVANPPSSVVLEAPPRESTSKQQQGVLQASPRSSSFADILFPTEVYFLVWFSEHIQETCASTWSIPVWKKH